MKMKTLLPSFMLFACTFQTIALNSETQNTIIKLEQSVISVGQLITQIEIKPIIWSFSKVVK